MKRYLGFWLTLGAAAIACGAGCGNEVTGPGAANATGSGGAGGEAATTTTTTNGTTTSTTSTGTGQGGGDGAQPPPPGPPMPGDGAGVVYAVSKLFLGDTDRDGTPNAATGWKQYGYDLDHAISTKDSVDLCKPAAGGAPPAIYPDGTNGIDNSFGKNILPILLGLAPDSSDQVNASINDGELTLVFDLHDLGPQSSYNPLLARHYLGADLGSPPAFDGADVWPIDPASLTNPGDITSAKLPLPESYLTGNTWVSGPSQGTLELPLSMAGFTLPLRIHHVVITMDLAPDHATATNGTIAGVLDTEEFAQAMIDVMGAFDPSLCSGSTADSITNQLRQASDILADATQDPALECNAISIGIGFNANPILLGPIAPATPPPPDACP